MGKDIIGMIDKSTIFRPSFINSFQGRLYRFMEKFPKGQKFRIIIEPVEKKKSDDEEFTITENTRLSEIAEHDPEKFRQIMYAIYGPGWQSYIKWKTAVSSESFADMVNKYLESHKPTPEDIERMKEIPPDDLKVMVNAWWDEFILGGDKHENDCESAEGDSAGT